ncbi:MAG TPA: hypothetical protein VMN78_03575 [Longimicrobiales bacterium]|nr:hypothetical protein [Longimicrobiales bacterium]
MPILSRVTIALLLPVVVLLTLALTDGSVEPPPPADSAALTWRLLHRHEGQPRGPNGLGVVLTTVSREGSRIHASAPGRSFRSDDGGASWTEVEELKNAWDIARGAAGLMLVGRDGGRISRSTDGGESWTDIPTGGEGRLSVAVSGRNAFAAGKYAVLRSTDAGETWTRVAAPRVYYGGVAARGPMVLVVGSAGLVVRSPDGGETWHHQWLPTRATLHTVAFADERTAVIATSDGTLLRSTDAGVSWTEVESPALARLIGIAFDPDGHGLAVGFWGEVVRSTDRGASWQRERSPTHLHLLDVRADPTGGFLVVGFRETILSATTEGRR